MKHVQLNYRFALCWLVIWAAGSAYPALAAEDQDRRDLGEIVDFLERYFTAARIYDEESLLSIVSRRRLERNIRPLLISSTDAMVLRSNENIFQAEALNGSFCRFFVAEVTQVDGETQATIYATAERHGNHSMMVFDVYLVEEQSALRFDRNSRYLKSEIKNVEVDAQIDICHLEPGEDNPVIVR